LKSRHRKVAALARHTEEKAESCFDDRVAGERGKRRIFPGGCAENGKKNDRLLQAGRLKPKGFQRRFAYFLDEEKVGRRRLNQLSFRWLLPTEEKKTKQKPSAPVYGAEDCDILYLTMP